MFFQSNDDITTAIFEIRQIQIQLLKIVSSLAIIAVPIIWICDIWILHAVNPIDQIGYPALILSFAFALGTLQLKPSAYSTAALISIGTFAIYMETYLQTVVYGHSPSTSVLSVADFALWFPLVYLTLFLFLERQIARFVSSAFYVSFALPLFFQGVSNWGALRQEEVFPFLLHMVCSHPIYIVILAWIEMVQRSFVLSQQQLNSAMAIASTDCLTDILNRRGITEILQQALEPSHTQKMKTAAMLLDIDHFKNVNDTFGHDVGDEVLREMANLLRRQIRSRDTVGRWGGEEFIIIAPVALPDEANLLAEHICQAIAHHPFVQVGHITASVGVAIATPADSVELLTKRADIALYKAKRMGRNRVHMVFEGFPLAHAGVQTVICSQRQQECLSNRVVPQGEATGERK